MGVNKVATTTAKVKLDRTQTIATNYTVIHSSKLNGCDVVMIERCLKDPYETLVEMCERYNINPYDVDWVLRGWPDDVTKIMLNTLERMADELDDEEDEEDDELLH
jgi:hypothetical protein